MNVIEIPMFDLADFGVAEAWAHDVPETFSLAYYPAKLRIEAHEAARELYIKVRREHADPAEAWARKERMWHVGMCSTTYSNANGHALVMFSSSVGICGCPKDGYRINPRCHCVGASLNMAQCDTCQWQTVQVTEESAAAAWHDHAWPGWRGLPVVPLSVERKNASMGPSKQLLGWLAEHYPAGWMGQPFAPIVTERAGVFTRSVPGGGPGGGYDLSHTALTAVVT